MKTPWQFFAGLTASLILLSAAPTKASGGSEQMTKRVPDATPIPTPSPTPAPLPSATP